MKRFPHPPTWQHVVANALAELAARARQANRQGRPGVRHLMITRAFFIERRFVLPKTETADLP